MSLWDQVSDQNIARSFSDPDDPGDSLVTLLIVGGGYLLFNLVVNRIRDASATDNAGAVFSPQAPGGAAGAVDSSPVTILAPLRLSPAGEAFIKAQEGYSAAIRNDAGHPSAGWGHTLPAGYTGPVTLPLARQWFAQDVATAERAVSSNVSVPLSQNQFDALVSLAYNIGGGPKGFAGSTLLKLLNQGDYAGAAAQFPAWNKSTGQYNQGLANRRQAEQGLFNTATSSPAASAPASSPASA